MIFCLWYFIHALGKVCDSLMVYRSGLLSIISHRSIVQSFTIRYFHYRDVLSIDALRSFSRIWTKGFVGSIGLSSFEISARSGGKLAENGMRGNADTRLGEILKGEQAGGAGRQAGRGLCPVEEQTTTPTHPKISSPE